MNRPDYYRRGMEAFSAGRYREAIRLLTPLTAGRREARALISRYYLAQARHRLGVECFRRRSYREAIEHFRAAVQFNPSGGDVGRYLAACFAGISDFPSAERQWTEDLAKDPANSDIRVRLAMALFKQGKQPGAEKLLRAGLQRSPSDSELNYHLGVMLASRDETAEATRCFKAALRHNDRHAGALERLAQCAAVEGRHHEVLPYLRGAYEADPSNPRVVLQMSLLLQSQIALGQPPLIELNRAAATPLDPKAIERLAEVVVEEPEFVETFLSLPPSDVDAEVFLAVAATLERALAERPEFADLHYHCGQVYHRLGHTDSAIKHAEQATRINPRYLSALSLLGRLYADTDRNQVGIDRLQQAVEAGADYPDVHLVLGDLFCKERRWDQARTAYERALRLNGTFEPARKALAGLATAAV